MPSTDTRIVQMQFDNRDFEKNIAVSDKSLEKFKEELDFDKQEQNLRDFGDAANRINFDSMAENLQKLTDKFTGLGTISELVLSQLRRGIENAAAKVSGFVSSLTVEQVNAGMSKFEMLNKSVQTIKAATGDTEESVYKVLDRLNKYTDQTSYNFADMAQNIGKFTSVGIPLEKAERQMEGIANWAARSGAGVAEASRAMYNLSQAMGVGSLKLMDWKSIENAGMATKEFKEQLIDSGIALGTLEVTYDKGGNRIVKTAKSLGTQTEVTYKNVSETLNKGWANQQVIGTTLEKYYYEDLYYTGQVASLIETTKEQRDEIRKMLQADNQLSEDDWAKVGLQTENMTQQIMAAAVEQKKIAKEVSDEGYEVYYMLDKNGKKTKTVIKDIQDLFSNNLIDTSMAERLFGLNNDAILEVSDKQLEVIRSALGENDLILKKDWIESLDSVGLATDEVKLASLEAAAAVKNLEKTTNKDGTTVYKTAKKYGKQMEITLDNYEDMLKYKWFDADVADVVFKIKNLGKASYESAQKCLTFSDVLGAWKDMLSTGWMQTYNHIFGQLTESMQLFSTICNKVSDALAVLMDERNKILEIWASWGGRTNLWSMLVGEYGEGEDLMYEGAYGFLDVLIDIGNLIHDGFWNMIKLMVPGGDWFEQVLAMDEFKKIFPEFEGTFDDFWETEGGKESFFAFTITNIINKIKEFIQSIKDFMNEIPAGAGKSRLQMVQDVVNGIFATALLIYTIFKRIAAFFGGILERLQPGIDAVLKLLSRLGIGISDTAREAHQGEGLTNFFNGLLNVLQPLIDAANKIIIVLSELFTKIIDKGTQNGSFNKILDFFGKLLTVFVDIISSVAGPLIDFIADVIDAFGTLFEDGINEESMKAFGEKLSNALEKLVDGIFEGIFGKEAGEKLNEMLAYLFGFDEKDLPEGEAKTLVGSIRMWFKKIFELVGSIFDGFKNENGEVTLFSLLKSNLGIGGVMNFLKQLNNIFNGSNIFGILKTLGVLMTLWKAFKAFSAAKETFSGIKGFFQGLNDSLKEGFKLKVNDVEESAGDKFLKIAEGVAVLGAAVAILGSLKISSLIKGAAAIGAIMLMMYFFVKSMKSQIEGMGLAEIISMTASIGLMGLSITSIALAVSLLILALKPLASMRIDQILTMLVGFLGIITILGLFVKSLADKNIGGVKAKDMFAIGLLALGIGIMVRALKPLANMQFDQILNMMIGLGGVLAELVIFAKYMTGTSFSDKGLWSLVGLAVGIGVLMMSLRPIADIPMDGIWNMLIALGGVLAELAIFSKYFGTFKGAGLGKTILLAAGIYLLLEALKPIASINAVGIIKMLFSLGIILLELKLFNDGLGSYRFGEMAGLIALAMSIWLLMKALMPLTNISWEGLAKAIVGLGAVLLMLYLFMENAKGMKPGEAAAGLLAMIGLAAVLLLFGFSMNLISEVSWGKIVVAVVMLSVLMVVYFSLVDMINNNENALLKGTHALVAMIGLAVVLLAFSIALNEIKNVDTGKILAFSIGLAALLIAVGAALKLTKGLSLGAAVKGIVILGIAVAAMMAVLALMMPIVAGAIGSSLQNMSAKLTLTSDMIANFVGKMKQFSASDIDEAKIKFEKLVELFASLKDVSGYYNAVQSFSTLLVDLGAGVSLFASMTAQIPDPETSAAIKTVQKLLDMKESFTGFTMNNFPTEVTLLGAGLSLFASMTQSITKENPPVLKLADRILKMKDRFAAFTIGSFASEATRIGSALWLFNATTSGVTTDNPLAVSLLSKILGFKKDIDAFKSVDVDGFSSKLTTLGGALSLYASGASEVSGLTEEDTPDVTKAVGLLQAISESFHDDDGNFTIPEISQSESDLALFGAKLSALATAMKSFSEASDGLDDGKTALALKVLSFLKDLQTDLTEDNLKRVGIFKDTSISEYTISTFSTDIVALAGALKAFTEGANTFDEGKTGLALKVLAFLKDLQTDLTTDNLKVVNAFKDAGITSSYTITTFSTEITALGEALGEFATKTSGVGDLANAKSALTFLSWLKSNLTAEDIKTTLIFKGLGVTKESMEQFAKDITSLGEALASFANNVNFDEGTTQNFDAALKSLEFLQKLQLKMPVMGGIKGFIEGNVETLGVMASDIISLGSAMKEFSDALTGGGNADLQFDMELVNQALNALSTMADLTVTMLSDSLTDNQIYAADIYFGQLGQLFDRLNWDTESTDGMVSNQHSAIEGLAKFMMEVNTEIDKLGGIDSTTNLEAFKTTLESLKTLADITQGDEALNFQPVGYQIAAGVAQGILSDEANAEVVAAARTMIQRIKDAAADEAIIESPSVLFADSIGRYISLGIGQGIRDNTDDPEKAANDAVTTTLFGAQGALDMLWNLLTNGIDTDPTIRPVIDLTNVKAGVTAMNGMFGGSYGMTINPSTAESYARAAVPDIREMPQNTVDLTGVMNGLSTVSEQITSLGDRIANLKIYLDKNTLVGSLTGGIDSAIGRRGFYSGRRN